MPNNVLSPVAVVDAFYAPRSNVKDDLVDYDLGPIAISDPSQGLMYQSWKGVYSGGNVIYSSATTPSYTVDTIANVKELSITFDQNGHPCYAAMVGLSAVLYWYDPVSATFEYLNLPAGAKNPRVALDDKRAFDVSNSDVLLFYLYNGQLCMRVQRDRYGVEYQLASVPGDAVLTQVGMNVQQRFQIFMQKPGIVA